LLNDGTGNLVPQSVVPVKGAGALVLADFDGDGNRDAAVAISSGASVSLFHGDGSGNLSSVGAYLTGRTPVSLAASDPDGNGTTDLVTGDNGTQDLRVLLFTRP